MEQRRGVHILLFLLTLVLTACSLTKVGRGNPIPIPSTSNSLDGLNSYKARMVLEWMPEGGLPSTMTTEIEVTRSPFVKKVTIKAGEETQEWVYIGETQWYCTEGTCFPQGKAASKFGEEIFLWDDEVAKIFKGLDYHYIGEETVNGLHTLHYAIASPPPGVFGPLREDASDVQTDIWVVNDKMLPTFAVRVINSWRLAKGERGKGKYSVDIYDVNTLFTIEPPGRILAEARENIPLVGTPPSQLQLSYGESVRFSTQENPGKVAEFYQIELMKLGWRLENEEKREGIIVQIWDKGDFKLLVTISPKEDGCTVAIEMKAR